MLVSAPDPGQAETDPAFIFRTSSYLQDSRPTHKPISPIEKPIYPFRNPYLPFPKAYLSSRKPYLPFRKALLPRHKAHFDFFISLSFVFVCLNLISVSFSFNNMLTRRRQKWICKQVAVEFQPGRIST
jgi:hypothetical protein